ncbi:hypothetical protein K3495_g12021 [Podosphaera aphanis]|nr:hypothetical protein K3495_g12021 [Podosphaera aphanis]
MSTYQNPLDDSDDDDQRFGVMQAQIDALRTQLESQAQAAPTGVVIEKDPPAAEGLRFRPTELPEYDGSRPNYPAWRRAVLLIFKMDWNTFQYTDTRAFLLSE